MDKQESKKKICITGGHLSPAVAVIEEIKARKKPWDIVFVGRAKTSHLNANQSEDKSLVEKMGIPFIAIHAGRFSRFFSLHSFFELFLIPVGFIESFVFCLREKPDCIVSFGGYVGLPVVKAGWLLGIPTIIHEQTHVLGLANKIASEFADKIVLTFPDARMQKDTRVSVVGLPLRAAFLHPPKKISFPIPADKPILYVTGGTTGAASMNDLIFPIIHSFVHTYTVIHQTGQKSYAKALTVLDTISKEEKNSYIPMEYIESGDVAWILRHAHLVIGRSGANTVAEVAAVRKPAVFIPLPWGSHQEQRRNATWYASIGGDVTIVDQPKTSSEQLEKIIVEALQSQGKTSEVTRDEGTVTATAAIVQSIASLM